MAAERFPGLLAQYSSDHYGIYEAVRDGDTNGARARAQAHVERAIHYIQLVFRADEQSDDTVPTDAASPTLA
jgi:DNA-binding FadR family transcriptional regulator